jgi:hypothetical protein
VSVPPPVLSRAGSELAKRADTSRSLASRSPTPTGGSDGWHHIQVLARVATEPRQGSSEVASAELELHQGTEFKLFHAKPESETSEFDSDGAVKRPLGPEQLSPAPVSALFISEARMRLKHDAWAAEE